MFRVTNRSTVFQMVWLQDVVKVTLQTFSPAVGLFKKKYCIFWSCDSTFLTYILGIGTRKVPLLFGCQVFISLATSVVNLKCPQIIINLAVSFEERHLKPEKWTRVLCKTQLFKKYQYWIQQNHNKILGESSVQRSDDKSYLVQRSHCIKIQGNMIS